MSFRHSEFNDRWYVDCDTHEERTYTSVCWQFQATVWARSDLTLDRLEAKARLSGWSTTVSLDGVPLTFCPGCVPLAIRTADVETLRAYLRGLAKPLTWREQKRRMLR